MANKTVWVFQRNATEMGVTKRSVSTYVWITIFAVAYTLLNSHGVIRPPRSEDMTDHPSSLVIQELHDDLARKYKTHAAEVETAWRSFNHLQRARCIRAGAEDGHVLHDSSDTRQGDAYKIIPDWNLTDLARHPDYLLNMLKYRATKTLFEQYRDGVDNTAGDYKFMENMIQVNNLHSLDSLKNCYTFFLPKLYGESLKIASPQVAGVLAHFEAAIQGGSLVPQFLGELVLNRQARLLQCLKRAIEHILNEASNPQKTAKLLKRPMPAAKEKTVKVALPDVIASARGQKSSVDKYLTLLRTEPTVLSQSAKDQLFKRHAPLLSVYPDGPIGMAVFQAVHQAVQATAIWQATTGLLNLLKKPSLDKRYKATILQELSNLCHFEYTRTQALLKHQVSIGIGLKWFKPLSRVPNDIGFTKLTLKGNPEELTRKYPHLHYLLKLGQPSTTVLEAAEWMQKLNALYTNHPLERHKLFDRESRAIFDLAAVVAFVQDLSSVFSLPSPSREKGHQLVSGLQGVEAKLDHAKKGFVLGDLVTYISDFQEAIKAPKALETLDQYVSEKVGKEMGSLYQDELDEMFQHIEEQYRQTKDKLDRDSKEVFIPLEDFPQNPAKQVESPREKEKTRPSHSSIYTVTPSGDAPSEKESAPSPDKFKVSPATAGVFETLFDKAQAQGSVSWTAFEAAMAELGFSIQPRLGSIYTLRPPATMSIRRAINIHRPHHSEIQGFMCHFLARRLNRVYGWSDSSFETL